MVVAEDGNAKISFNLQGKELVNFGKMSEAFEGCERQYCELSANLTRKCTAAGALVGGSSSCPFSYWFWYSTCRLKMNFFSFFFFPILVEWNCSELWHNVTDLFLSFHCNWI